VKWREMPVDLSPFKGKKLVEEACEVWKSECYDSQQRDY
jgi:hypothetical protein